MSNNRLTLGSEFPAASEQMWLSMVEKVLKGADYEKTLVSQTYDELNIDPLYHSLQQHPANPGEFPYTRAVSADGFASSGWQIAQRYAHPDPKVANQQILEDLQKGVTRIRIDVANEHNVNDAKSLKGIHCISVADLETLFKDVRTELVPIDINAGHAFYEFALALLAFYDTQELPADSIDTNLGADPGAALAQSGSLPDSVDAMLHRLFLLADMCQSNYPTVKAISIDTSVYHNAGASHSQEIALALATGLTYLRAMTNKGMTIDDACQQIRFFLTSDTDYFQCIAKFRSLRQLWSMVCKLSGAGEQASQIDLHASTSERILSQRDPWVNMLRATMACNAAAIGGASSITTACFDQAVGQNVSSLGRRISRNTQLLLQEESSIHKIVDPAGGSWFIESHTNALSEKAWAILQEVEKQGGLFAALQNKFIQNHIADTRNKRMNNIAKRRQALTGVSEFAHLDEAPLAATDSDLSIYKTTAERIKLANRIEALTAQDLSVLKKELKNNALIPALGNALAGSTTRIEPLPSVRLGSEFEALRDASDAYYSRTKQRPTVSLITLGTPAQFNARAGFANNFFAAGGIATQATSAGLSAEEAAAQWQESGYSIAVLCSTDEIYQEKGKTYIEALRQAGAKCIVITGKALTELSDIQIHLNSNTLDILNTMHQILEVDNHA